jgi:hypothetical protein
MSEANPKDSLDESLRKHVKTFGPPGALAVLAFGYRAVEIWREEYPRDWDKAKKAAETRRKELEEKAKAAKAKKDAKDKPKKS